MTTNVQLSRKQKVRNLYNEKGPEYAWVLSRKLGIKDNSTRSWLSQWRRADGTPKGTVARVVAKAKPAPKVKAKAAKKANGKSEKVAAVSA